jgi:hypothetical protein
MKTIGKSLFCIGVLLFLASLTAADENTWTGQTSDSMCAGDHSAMMASHTDSKMTAHDCTIACVKAGGKYVFISEGKTYNIANQDDADLEMHARHTVRLTGTIDGDTITVTKVVMPPKKASQPGIAGEH